MGRPREPAVAGGRQSAGGPEPLARERAAVSAAAAGPFLDQFQPT